MAGRGSISDTPDRSLCRRDPVSSPSPCSRRSRPEIISTSLLPAAPLYPRSTFWIRSSTDTQRRRKERYGRISRMIISGQTAADYPRNVLIRSDIYVIRANLSNTQILETRLRYKRNHGRHLTKFTTRHYLRKIRNK